MKPRCPNREVCKVDNAVKRLPVVAGLTPSKVAFIPPMDLPCQVRCPKTLRLAHSPLHSPRSSLEFISTNFSEYLLHGAGFALSELCSPVPRPLDPLHEGEILCRAPVLTPHSKGVKLVVEERQDGGLFQGGNWIFV